MCIKSDAKNGQQYQKWLFAVSEISSKVGIGFIFYFLLKARVLFYCSLIKKNSLFLKKKSRSRMALLFNNYFHKNSSPRDKVGKLSSFWDWWAESVCIHCCREIYIIFPRANNSRSREKKNFWRSNLLTLSAWTIGILSTLTYTEFDCAALLAIL